METGLVYGLYDSGLNATADAVLGAVLIEALGLDPTALPLLLPHIATLKELLNPAHTVAEGFSQGLLGNYYFATGAISPVGTDLENLGATQPQESRFWELGYSGILAYRLLVSGEYIMPNRITLWCPLPW